VNQFTCIQSYCSLNLLSLNLLINDFKPIECSFSCVEEAVEIETQTEEVVRQQQEEEVLSTERGVKVAWPKKVEK
jgi:hypothetical protein